MTLNDDFILAKLEEKLFLGFLDSSDERLTLTALKVGAILKIIEYISKIAQYPFIYRL